MIIILILIKELPICMEYNTACILFHVEFICNEIVERNLDKSAFKEASIC